MKVPSFRADSVGKVTNPRPQLLIQWLRLCAALVETYMYARKTYLKAISHC